MSMHRYGLLLGSSLASAQVLQQARASLSLHGFVEAASQRVQAPSVAAGDLRRFHNQAVVFAVAWERDALAAWLKQIELRLGRSRDDVQCVIDIDLACECDAHGVVLWRDAAKLAHPLFVGLMQDALNKLRGSGTPLLK